MTKRDVNEGPFERVARGVELLLNTPKPRLTSEGNMHAQIMVPPVYLVGQGHINGEDYFLPTDWMNPEAFAALNVACAVEKGEDLYTFRWLRLASVKQRRTARLHSKYMVALSHGNFSSSGWEHYETQILSYIGGRWVDAIGARNVSNGAGERVGTWKKAVGDFFNDDVLLGMTMALTLRYQYSAVLTDAPSNLSARIFADSGTLRFMLRTRERGNLSRRRALIHLVRSHSRRRKRRLMVAAHLRGEHACRWQGLDVRMLPSQFDAEQSAGGAVIGRLRDEGLARFVGVS